jgi:hypothetical protein
MQKSIGRRDTVPRIKNQGTLFKRQHMGLDFLSSRRSGLFEFLEFDAVRQPPTLSFHVLAGFGWVAKQWPLPLDWSLDLFKQDFGSERLPVIDRCVTAEVRLSSTGARTLVVT